MPANVVTSPVQTDAVDRLSLAVADARGGVEPLTACGCVCGCMAEE